MRFIVFEGLDGSGKSTLMRGLSRRLEQLQISYLVTREPGGTVLGDQLRDLILANSEDPPSPVAELLMYEASRAQHVSRKILPALAQGQWVLCDRFTASSLAFQSSGRGLNWEQVVFLNEFATSGLSAHLTVLLDLSVESSKARRSQRESSSGTPADRIEAEADDFHQRVRDGFLRQAKADSKNWLVLSADHTAEDLLEELMSKLKEIGWL